LSDMAKELLLQKKLTIGQVRPLIGQENADFYLNTILKNRLNSRDIEKLIKKEKFKVKNLKNKSLDIIDLEKELSEITGVDIKINFNDLTQKGSIKLECKNLIEFNYIVKKIKT